MPLKSQQNMNNPPQPRAALAVAQGEGL